MQDAADDHGTDDRGAGKPQPARATPPGPADADQHGHVREAHVQQMHARRDGRADREAIMPPQPHGQREHDDQDACRLHQNDGALVGASVLGHRRHVGEAARHGREEGSRPVEARDLLIEGQADDDDGHHERHQDRQTAEHAAEAIEKSRREGGAYGNTEHCSHRNPQRCRAVDGSVQDRCD